MSSSLPLDRVTTAVLTLLRGTAERDKPQWVYDGAYTGDPVKPPYWYSILYQLPGGSIDPMPDLDANRNEITVVFQDTVVSNLRNSAQAGARIHHDRLLDRTPGGLWSHPLDLPEGWRDIDRRPDSTVPGVDRAGSKPAAVFNLPQRFYLTFART